MKSERKEILKKNLERVSAALDLFMDFQEEDIDLYPVIHGVKSQNDEAIQKTIDALDNLRYHLKCKTD